MVSADYDIAIVGAGMVGATLACALGASGLRIALLSDRAPEPPEPEIDLRVSALTRASQRIFAALGVWEAMTKQRVSPFRDMRVWDASGNGEIHFASADLGEPQLGWIVENRVIQFTLWQRARTFPNITPYCPAALDAITWCDDDVALTLGDGSQLQTRLLIGADGADSGVRRRAGIATRGWAYDQRAVVTTVATELPHQETAWQRFLSSGPLAFLPLVDGRCSIVWSTSPAQAEHLLALDSEAFAEALAEAFAWRLGRIIQTSTRAMFPLRLLHAQRYVLPRVALVGDAAHVIHPLAGQGVNLGLLDAAVLAQVTMESATAGHDIGSLKALRRYERWRKGENLMMLAAMDGLKHLFGTSAPPLRWLRNAGLNFTDALPPVKSLIARRAMGLAGDLPRLARHPA